MTSIDLMPGERVLWQGCPKWRSMACSLARIHWIAAYFGAWLLWGAYSDRSHGLSPLATLLAALPLALLALLVIGAGAGFAAWCAATTRYVITDERCIITYGMALTATLSVPLRRVAAVAVSLKSGGQGDVALGLQAGRGIAYLKAWPHARPWHWRRPQPMLRDIEAAAAVADLIGAALQQRSAGGVVRAARPPAAQPAFSAAPSTG